jgi:hypothetical protein
MVNDPKTENQSGLSDDSPLLACAFDNDLRTD